MTTSEYLELFMVAKKETVAKPTDERSAYDIAQLTSGSFVFSLHEVLSKADMEMDMIAEYLENLYDSEDSFGLIYFIMMLADATGFSLPRTFIEMSLNDDLIYVLSAAIIDDWLDA